MSIFVSVSYPRSFGFVARTVSRVARFERRGIERREENDVQRRNVRLLDSLDPLKYLKQRATFVIWRNSEISFNKVHSTKLEESKAIDTDLKFHCSFPRTRSRSPGVSVFEAGTEGGSLRRDRKPPGSFGPASSIDSVIASFSTVTSSVGCNAI